MDPSIGPGDIKNVAKTLGSDEHIFRNIHMVMDSLETPPSDQEHLVNQFRIGNITGYALLNRILSIWISSNGKRATFLKLTKILMQMSFMDCAEQIVQTFGSRMELPEVDNNVPAQLPLSETDNNMPTPVLSIPQQGNVASAVPPISAAQSKKAERLERLNKWKSYPVLSYLGAGSFGFVFKIRKTQTSEPTAVKIVIGDSPLIDTAESDNLRATNTELQAMTKLARHKNVVQLINHDVLFPPGDDSTPGFLKTYGDAVNITTLINPKSIISFNSYTQLSNRQHTFVLEMELCGKTLREWLSLDETWKKYKELSSNPAFLENQIEIAQGIIAGLKHIHQNGMMHRDLKPENVYFAKEGFKPPVKIGDFGLTRQMSGNASVTQTEGKGTEIYRAPEVYSGKYGQQADLYSLGLVLWEVFEIVPIAKSSQAQNLTSFLKHRFDALTIDRELDTVQVTDRIRDLKETIIKLTKRKKEDRMKSIDDVQLEFVESESDSESSMLC